MQPVRVDELMTDLGRVDGHRLVLLSLEVYDDWADLRFARIDEQANRPLPRRVPASTEWLLDVDGVPATVVDAVGRGDRAFSNGEVRFRPPPASGAKLRVAVRLREDDEPLVGTVTCGGRGGQP